MRGKRLVAAIGFLAIASGFLAWRLWRKEEVQQLRLSGLIELETVQLGFKMPGRIARILVDEGDPVSKTQVLAELDVQDLKERRASLLARKGMLKARMKGMEVLQKMRAQELEARLGEAQAVRKRAQATLEKVERGPRVQELEQARIVVERASSEYQQAARDLERARELVKTDDISKAEFERFEVAYQIKKAALEQARQQLALLQEGSRPEDIEAARAELLRADALVQAAEASRLELERLRHEIEALQAEIESLDAEIAALDIQIDDAVLRAPFDGVVLTRSAEEGEVLAAGTPVLEIGNLARTWVRAYVSEPFLGRIRLGQPAFVYTDSYPNRKFEGTLTFISSEAEFAPREILTEEERVRFVYRIHVDVPNPDGLFKLNMPVEVELPLQSQ